MESHIQQSHHSLIASIKFINAGKSDQGKKGESTMLIISSRNRKGVVAAGVTSISKVTQCWEHCMSLGG